MTTDLIILMESELVKLLGQKLNLTFNKRQSNLMFIYSRGWLTSLIASRLTQPLSLSVCH